MNRPTGVIAARSLVVEGDLHIGDYDQVKITVAVEIAKARRGRPPVREHSGGGRHILEGPIAAVPVEDCPPQTGYEQVIVAVIVVVADRRSPCRIPCRRRLRNRSRRERSHRAGCGTLGWVREGSGCRMAAHTR